MIYKKLLINNYSLETIDKIRRGYYSAIYFWRTKEILEKDGNLKTATMQIFQRHDAIVCGIDEVVKLLRVGAGYWEKDRWISSLDQLRIETLDDGSEVQPLDTIIHITGPYHTFVHLESIYLGILARRTLVATNVRKAVKAASGKPVIFFADRFDHFLAQEGDGYAAKIGGASGVATPAQGVSFGGKTSGTMPHALIALYEGNTNKAAEKFARYHPDTALIVLVDFDNDVVKTSLEVAKKFGKKLWGVRIDTSYDLIDASLTIQNQVQPGNGPSELQGVNPYTVNKLREELDKHGYSYVKIVASGGFTVDKIAFFEKMRTSVDVYGVGSALVKGENDFTADIVRVEGKPVSKVGREFRPNGRLRIIK